MDQVIGTVGLHLQFFQDDALFLIDILGPEHRVKHQVGENVHGEREVLVEHFGVEAHQFLRGEGIEIAPDRVHRARDIFGRAAGGAFEKHMLDEV